MTEVTIFNILTPGVQWYLRALKSYALYSNSISNPTPRMTTNFFHPNVGGRESCSHAECESDGAWSLKHGYSFKFIEHMLYKGVRPNVLTRVSNGCITFVQSPLSLVELENQD